MSKRKYGRLFNIIAISLYQADCDQNCLNSSIAPVNYVCFFLGVICIIMLLIFLILMPCYIMDSYNRNFEYHQEIIKEKETKTDFKPDDILMHSSLYSQNSINENTGSLKSNIIDYVETNYNQYPVIQANV